jgi:hypothetical protein
MIKAIFVTRVFPVHYPADKIRGKTYHVFLMHILYILDKYMGYLGLNSPVKYYLSPVLPQLLVSKRINLIKMCS